jgi:hypothetical protein
MQPTHPPDHLPTVTQLIYKESGGFTGLQRGCTIEPQALPDTPRAQLQHLLVQPQTVQDCVSTSAGTNMPDMLVYSLEMVMLPDRGNTAAHRTVQYPAGDVPDDVTDLIDFLQTLAHPLPM